MREPNGETVALDDIKVYHTFHSTSEEGIDNKGNYKSQHFTYVTDSTHENHHTTSLDYSS